MATGTAGERGDEDVPAHLRVTDEIRVDAPARPEVDAQPADASSAEASWTEVSSADASSAEVPTKGASGEFTGEDASGGFTGEGASGGFTGEADVPAVSRPPAGARPVAATDVQLRPVVPPPEPPPRPYAPPATVQDSVPFPPIVPPRPPGSTRSGTRLPRVLGVSAAALGALFMGIGFVLVYGLFAGTGGPGPSAGPCGHRPCAARPSSRDAVSGAQIAYRTVERDVGYFEGTVTITNHGAQPMPSWTLSFRYPGADIHNTWDAVLQRGGAETVLTGTATSRPIAPGATLEVRFGGSGSPSMPTDCRLNGAPCAFVAR